ncbi:hypothetical protein BDZ97DRAFT_1753012 [Flammula alnicola]|nr:hypothetical protein BDZ97DRAFT_1753012 [Flammula alnicola]
MADFPTDEDPNELIISPSGSAFDALYTLNPPSPILTPSQLTFTWSSGDIPVLLYDDAYMDAFAESSASYEANEHINPGNGGKRDSSATLRGIAGASAGIVNVRLSAVGPPATTRDQRRESIRTSPSTGIYIGSGPELIGSLESSNTVSSVGTFGPRRKTLRAREISQYFEAPGPVLLPDIPFPKAASTTLPDKRSNIQTNDAVSRKRSSTQTLSGVFSNPSVLLDGNRSSRVIEKRDSGRPNQVDPEECRQTPDYTIVEEASGFRDDDETNNSLTPKKAVSKTTVPRDPRFPPAMHITSAHDKGSSPPRQVTPTRRSVLGRHDINTQNIDTLHPFRANHEPHGHNHRSEKPPKSENHPDQPHFSLQEAEHSWLKHITVQFLIDQEGFRAAQPSFRFTGIVRLRSSQHSKSPDAVMAQFRPVPRQAFHFHYAPFETPPILRRVTVNGDETHDYVSKQALLTLKTNGVYVLNSHEILSGSHHHDAEALKLHWRFEYVVDDRLMDASGKVMEGEKVLTPLTFSCTPALMLSFHGKKNTIMHIFKKGVAPKLISEKLQPPGSLKSSPNRSANAGTLTSSQTDAHISHFFLSKAQAWNLHRRGQSHSVRHAGMPKTSSIHPTLRPGTVSHQNRGVEDTDPREQESRPMTRRRRNSSAAGHCEFMQVGPQFSTVVSSSRHRREVSGVDTHAFVSPTRHIIPPAQLTELLDTVAKEDLVAPEPTSGPAVLDRNSSGFVPLTPRPRHTTIMKHRDPARAQ